MWMEEKETKLLAKPLKRNHNILLWGWSKGGNYYMTCVAEKRCYVPSWLSFGVKYWGRYERRSTRRARGGYR